MVSFKLKSKKAFNKRFKSTAKGNLKRKRAYTSHLFINKTTKQKRHLRKASFLAKSDQKRLRSLINRKRI